MPFGAETETVVVVVEPFSLGERAKTSVSVNCFTKFSINLDGIRNAVRIVGLMNLILIDFISTQLISV